jgi:hypothetical protein
MKLSKVQTEVLQMMNDGWELRTTQGTFNPSFWLHKNDKGTKTKDIRSNTFFVLWQNKLIEETDKNSHLPITS